MPPKPLVSSAAANQRGILFMLSAVFFLGTNDAIVKLAVAHLPPGQIMALRAAVALLMMIAILGWQGQFRGLGVIRNRLVATRVGLDAVNSAMFVTALALMEFATVVALVQAAPLIVAAIAALLLGEPTGWRRWLATAAGFLGVIIVARPGAHGIEFGAILAILVALTVAVRDLVTRRIAASVPSLMLTFYSAAGLIPIGLILGLGESWRWPTAGEWALITAAAAAFNLGNLCIIAAFRSSDVTVVSPFRYTVFILGFGYGYLLWGTIPDTLAILGMVLIAGSGLYILHRERVRGRQALGISA